MADGREEREERERRIQEEKPQDREDRVERHEADEWTPERVDSTGNLVTCSCDITGCDESAGGGSPAFISVSIPSGYPVQPIIPFTSLQSFPLVPTVKVPYGGT